jgi:hypothetical protein
MPGSIEWVRSTNLCAYNFWASYQRRGRSAEKVEEHKKIDNTANASLASEWVRFISASDVSMSNESWAAPQPLLMPNIRGQILQKEPRRGD